MTSVDSFRGRAMTDPDEIRAYYDAATDRMRDLMDELARHPDFPRPYPEIEDSLGWAPLSVRGTFSASTRRIGRVRFDDRWPFHLSSPGRSRSGRWETWMDSAQAAAIRGSSR